MADIKVNWIRTSVGDNATPTLTIMVGPPESANATDPLPPWEQSIPPAYRQAIAEWLDL